MGFEFVEGNSMLYFINWNTDRAIGTQFKNLRGIFNFMNFNKDRYGYRTFQYNRRANSDYLFISFCANICDNWKFGISNNLLLRPKLMDIKILEKNIGISKYFSYIVIKSPIVKGQPSVRMQFLPGSLHDPSA